MKKIASLAVCLCALFFASQLAFAHAHLLSSAPGENGVVHGPAIHVDLKFNSRVDSSRSHLDLVLPNGKIQVLKIAPAGEAELAAQTSLAPGKYVIRWQALATDGHITRGEIPFTVQ